MRNAILFTCLVLSSAMMFAQTPLDEQTTFRTLAREQFQDKAAMLDEIFRLTDSLGTKLGRESMHKLDSLETDSMNKNFAVPVIEMSKHHFYLIQGNPSMASTAIKKAQAYFDLSETQEAFKFKMNRYAAGYFESTGEIVYALTARKRMSQAYELLYEGALAEWKGSSDSLMQSESRLQKELNKQKETATHDRRIFMQAIAGAGIIILILLLVIFFSRWSWKKKLKAALNKPQDTSETDMLNARIQELNNDVNQYKHTAQLTINKLNHFDTTNRKVTQSLQQLKEEVSKVLDEINTQNEQQKSGSSPAAYMLVRNSISRTASVVEEHIKQTLSLLK